MFIVEQGIALGKGPPGCRHGFTTLAQMLDPHKIPSGAIIAGQLVGTADEGHK